MGHMLGAVSFCKSVTQKLGMKKECAIKVGGTVLDSEQQRYLLSAKITFEQIEALRGVAISVWILSIALSFIGLIIAAAV